MKTKFLIIAFASLLLSTSCKNDKKPEAEETNKPAVKENFSVELDVTAAKKDDFALYYTEDNTVAFTGEKAIWTGVKGGNADEKITFNLAQDIIPTDLRLDFGMNKEQESVTVKNVKITYYGKDLIFKGSEFFNWFVADKQFQTETDPAAGTLKILKSGAEYKTPYFYPRQELVTALAKLTAPTAETK